VCGAALGLGLVGGSALAAEGETNKTGKAEAAPAYQPAPAIARQNHVVVRGQAGINSEIVTHLQKGQLVTVLQEITLKKPKTDEPARWDRIALPPETPVWVHGDFVDKATKTVRPHRLNLRGGPSENYSIVGRVEKGTALNVLGEKGAWLKIASPSNAFGFVAAHLLLKDAAAVAAATGSAVAVVPKEPATTSVPVPPVPVPTAKTNEAPVVAVAPVVITPPPAAVTNVEVAMTNVVVAAVAETNALPVPATPPTSPTLATNMEPVAAVTTEPPATNAIAGDSDKIPPSSVPPPELVKRVVTHEGLLKGTFSVLAPTHFELRSVDNNRLINYVWSPTTNIVLKPFKGRRVMVTGEEYLDERWANVPVIIVDEIKFSP